MNDKFFTLPSTFPIKEDNCYTKLFKHMIFNELKNSVNSKLRVVYLSDYNIFYCLNELPRNCYKICLDDLKLDEFSSR